MAIEKLKELTERMKENFVRGRNEYLTWISESTQIGRRRNEMARLSSWAFVSAFDNIAKNIAEMLPEPYVEIYTALADDAIRRMARGDDHGDVLWHFEIMHVRMKRGEKI